MIKTEIFNKKIMNVDISEKDFNSFIKNAFKNLKKIKVGDTYTVGQKDISDSDEIVFRIRKNK